MHTSLGGSAFYQEFLMDAQTNQEDTLIVGRGISSTCIPSLLLETKERNSPLLASQPDVRSLDTMEYEQYSIRSCMDTLDHIGNEDSLLQLGDESSSFCLHDNTDTMCAEEVFSPLEDTNRWGANKISNEEEYLHPTKSNHERTSKDGSGPCEKHQNGNAEKQKCFISGDGKKQSYTNPDQEGNCAINKPDDNHSVPSHDQSLKIDEKDKLFINSEMAPEKHVENYVELSTLPDAHPSNPSREVKEQNASLYQKQITNSPHDGQGTANALIDQADSSSLLYEKAQIQELHHPKWQIKETRTEKARLMPKESIIAEEANIMNGFSMKLPRYLSVRNQMLEKWIKCPFFFLTKTEFFHEMKAPYPLITRLHDFLTRKEYINVGVTSDETRAKVVREKQSIRPRPENPTEGSTREENTGATSLRSISESEARCHVRKMQGLLDAKFKYVEDFAQSLLCKSASCKFCHNSEDLRHVSKAKTERLESKEGEHPLLGYYLHLRTVLKEDPSASAGIQILSMDPLLLQLNGKPATGSKRRKPYHPTPSFKK